MQDVREEITKREYLKYKSDPAAYHREREDEIPVYWSRGRGWYGCYCYESNGHYWRCDQIGESCD